VAVTRSEDWLTDSGLSTAETVGLWVCAGIHLVMFMFYTVALFHFIGLRNVAKVMICIHCIGIFGVRAVSLILAVQIYSVAAVDDFPTFAFFSVVIWFAAVWYAVLLPIIKQDFSSDAQFDIKNAFVFWIPFAVALFLFYIAIMIVFGTVTNTAQAITSCFGSISYGLPRWTTITIISFVYRLILISLSLIISISLLGYGYLVKEKLAQSAKSIRKKGDEIRLLLACHSLFFPIHALVLLLFTTFDYHNIGAGLTIIMFVEIVPGLAIMIMSMNPKGWKEQGFAGTTFFSTRGNTSRNTAQ